MKTLICSYLLAKSLFKRKFTWFDIGIARVLRDDYFRKYDIVPDYLHMIANLAKETTLPEAFADFMYELKRG
jgi:hypothetical protein